MLLPKVLAIHPAAPHELSLDLHVPGELAYFAGHFPGLPILPGVVQIDWAIRLAREHLPISGEFRSMEHIKFQALVLPAVQLALTLRWEPVKQQLAFSFATPARQYSSGYLVFGRCS